MQVQSATSAQLRLMELMCDFAAEAILGFLDSVYLKLGPVILAGDAVIPLILPVAETYFNYCAKNLTARQSPYLNARFDAMTSIPLAGPNIAHDCLNNIVPIFLTILQSLDLRGAVSEKYDESMGVVRVHVQALARRHMHLAVHLHGCTTDHVHEPITTDVFSFAHDKHVETETGQVKLTSLRDVI